MNIVFPFCSFRFFPGFGYSKTKVSFIYEDDDVEHILFLVFVSGKVRKLLGFLYFLFQKILFSVDQTWKKFWSIGRLVGQESNFYWILKFENQKKIKFKIQPKQNQSETRKKRPLCFDHNEWNWNWNKAKKLFQPNLAVLDRFFLLCHCFQSFKKIFFFDYIFAEFFQNSWFFWLLAWHCSLSEWKTEKIDFKPNLTNISNEMCHHFGFFGLVESILANDTYDNLTHTLSPPSSSIITLCQNNNNNNLCANVVCVEIASFIKEKKFAYDPD